MLGGGILLGGERNLEPELLKLGDEAAGLSLRITAPIEVVVGAVSVVDDGGRIDGLHRTGGVRVTTTGDVDAWAEVGLFYSTATVAAVLGVSMSTVYAWTRCSTVLCRTGSGRIVFPVWQFADGAVLLGLVPVLRVLRGSSVSRGSLASWLRAPEVELGGRTPLSVLQSGG